MNKKRLLPLIASVVMSAAFCFSGCGGCNNQVTPDDPGGDNPPVTEPEEPITTELVDIELDTSKVKKSFYVGENFSSSRLVVKAVTKRSDRDTTQVRDVSASARINSNAYRRTRVGEYVIKVSYTLGETTKEKSYTVSVKEVELSFDLTNVKTSYLVGEELDVSECKVLATTVEHGKDPVTEDITNSESLVVDASAYNKDKEGVYPVTASYTLSGGVIRTASFNVSAVYTKEGFRVTLAEGVSDTINLTADSPTATIDPTKIEVRRVDAYGNVIDEPVSPDDYENYTVEVYKENEKITNYTGLTGGTYQIWVTADSKTVAGYKISGFALIYVVEDVVANSFKKTSTGDTTQNIGVDVMTAGWTYEIRYATDPDTPVAITADKVTVTNLNTLSANNGTATVTYSYKLANGVQYSQSIQVPYSVVQGENQVKDTNTYDYAVLPECAVDSKPLKQEDFTGVNSFLTVVEGGTLNQRPDLAKDTDNRIEIQGDALQVTFNGVGTLSIKARGAGNSALAVIGVKRTDGETVKYMSASYGANVTELTYAQGKMYEVTGKIDEMQYITFVIDQPGTYTIFTVTAGPDGEETYTKMTRVYAIEKVDIYDRQA